MSIAPRTMVLLTVEEIRRLARDLEKPRRPSLLSWGHTSTEAERRRAKDLRTMADAVELAEQAKAERLARGE